MTKTVGVALAAVLVLLGITAAPVDAIVYWSNDNGDAIGRANNDGSRADPTWITGPILARGLAVNDTHIYWVGASPTDTVGSIGRAKLDGTDAQPELIKGVLSGAGIALDDTYVYWVNAGPETVGRARLDGSDAVQNWFIVPGSTGVSAVTVAGAYLYWTGDDDGYIGRVRLDNVAVYDAQLINTGGRPNGVAIDGADIYWTDLETNKLGHATLNGTGPPSGVDTAYFPLASRPIGVDVGNGYVYWANTATGAIARATPDRNLIQQDFLSGVNASNDVAVDALSIPEAPPPPPPPPAGIAPTISTLSQSHRVFRAGSRSTPLSGGFRRRHPRGTTFSLGLDQAAALTIRIQRKLPGRRVTGVCRRPTRRNSNRRPCTRLVTKATLRRTAVAGLNRIPFSGRIRGRALAPGRYRAVFRAANSVGTSSPKVLSFRIVAR